MGERKIIGILTDFGNRDGYVGVMKGVILGINPDVCLVDISNEISSHSIYEGAFVLYHSYKYFPRGTIFLVVVDPGVGTKREAIIITTRNYYFVAPNNGVASLAANEDGIVAIHKIENRKFMLEEISETFHGRDIFAPAAAYLSLGVKPSEFGGMLSREDFVTLDLLSYEKVGDKLVAKVVYIDKFGNVLISIPNKELDTYKIGSRAKIFLGDKEFEATYKRTYGEGRADEILILKGSHGIVEIAINMGNAAKILGCSIGEKMILEF